MHVTELFHISTELQLQPDDLTFERVPCKKHDSCICIAMYKGLRIHKTSSYRVTYHCPSCSARNTSLLSNLVKKLGKNEITSCISCSMSPVPVCENVCKSLPKDKDELSLVLPYTSFMAQIQQLGDFDYHPLFGSVKNNEPAIQFKESNQVMRLSNCEGYCQCCTAFFKMKAFKIRRDILQRPLLVCSECSQTWDNKLKCHGHIFFMTKFEHKFVKYCEKHCIPIENGLNIGIKRIAFYLPTLNTYVDVKSNVGWWERTRANAITAPLHIVDVIEDQVNAKYLIIYPRTYVSLTRTIKKSC